MIKINSHTSWLKLSDLFYIVEIIIPVKRAIQNDHQPY